MSAGVPSSSPPPGSSSSSSSATASDSLLSKYIYVDAYVVCPGGDGSQVLYKIARMERMACYVYDADPLNTSRDIQTKAWKDVFLLTQPPSLEPGATVWSLWPLDNGWSTAFYQAIVRSKTAENGKQGLRVESIDGSSQAFVPFKVDIVERMSIPGNITPTPITPTMLEIAIARREHKLAVAAGAGAGAGVATGPTLQSGSLLLPSKQQASTSSSSLRNNLPLPPSTIAAAATITTASGTIRSASPSILRSASPTPISNTNIKSGAASIPLAQQSQHPQQQQQLLLQQQQQGVKRKAGELGNNTNPAFLDQSRKRLAVGTSSSLSISSSSSSTTSLPSPASNRPPLPIPSSSSSSSSSSITAASPLQQVDMMKKKKASRHTWIVPLPTIIKDKDLSRFAALNPLTDKERLSEQQNGYKSAMGCFHGWEETRYFASKQLVVAPYVLDFS